MSRVERVEGDVLNLSAEELKAFRDWFMRFDAAAWDRAIEADSENGKLRSLAERALKDHEAGSRRWCDPLRRAGLLDLLPRSAARDPKPCGSCVCAIESGSKLPLVALQKTRGPGGMNRTATGPFRHFTVSPSFVHNTATMT
jgi:hypothetical protein